MGKHPIFNMYHVTVPPDSTTPSSKAEIVAEKEIRSSVDTRLTDAERSSRRSRREMLGGRNCVCRNFQEKEMESRLPWWVSPNREAKRLGFLDRRNAKVSRLKVEKPQRAKGNWKWSIETQMDVVERVRATASKKSRLRRKGRKRPHHQIQSLRCRSCIQWTCR